MGCSRELSLLLLLPALLPWSSAEKLGDGCGSVVIRQGSGTLTSKNYPRTYPNHTLCEKKIQLPHGKQLILKIGDLDIESQKCESNYLIIYNSTTVYGPYCGNVPIPNEIILDSREVTIRFESRSHISGRGFLLSFTSSDHPDLITCLEKGNHYTELKYSRYCPPGCRDIIGDISGNIIEGYRDTSFLCKSAIHAGIITDEVGGQINVVQLKGKNRYQGIFANDVLSHDGSLSDKRFIFNSNGCDKALNLGGGDALNIQMTASSSWDEISEVGDLVEWSPQKAWLKVPGPSWAANQSNQHQWLEIDLGEKTRITGIRTTGSTVLHFNYYIETFVVNYKNNNSKWRPYKGILNYKEKVFKANSNHGDVVRNNFIPPIVARFLRIIPQTWHKRIALKVELIGCRAAQSNSSLIHPLGQRPSQSTSVSTKKDDRSITEYTPIVETNSGLNLTAIIIPTTLMVLLVLFLVIRIFIALRKKRKKGATYGSSDTGKPNFWRQIQPSFVQYHSAEFTAIYTNEKETPEKVELITGEMADYQQPIMIGTGTVTWQGSTFKPMDTEDEKKCLSENRNHYNCLQKRNHHDYALPLTNQEPEYAMPIVERCMGTENGFSSDNCYNIPTVSSFPSGTSLAFCKADGNSGDYKIPQNIKEYDKPKGSILPVVDYNICYQKPQAESLTNEGYSIPKIQPQTNKSDGSDSTLIIQNS